MPSRSRTPTSPRAKVRCEGLIVEVGTADLDPRKARRLAGRVISDNLPGKWRLKPFGPDGRTFDVFPRGKRRPAVGRYWDWARALEAHRDVVSAEPALVLPGADPAPGQVFSRGERALLPKSGGDGPPLSCSRPFDWVLGFARVREAWAAMPPATRFGRGIRIGHPDTGYTLHPEFFDAERVLVAEGFDFEDGDPDPRDGLRGATVGHGASTGSVFMSAAGPGDAPTVTGIAPAASVVPIRITTGVVLLSFRKLAKAIYFAADKPEATRPHVLSMSVGGPFKARYLRRALQHAVSQGLIPIAAAGNVWPFVVYPAKFPEVVAVAACNCRSKVWKSSTGGRDVDLAAPGESVWRANTSRREEFTVEPSSGTSYATAVAAGACALWLAHHGYDRLVERYGRGHLAAIFKEVLTTAGVVIPPDWDTSRFGAGILDVERLLRAPLPATPPAGGLRSISAAVVPKSRGPVGALAEFFPGIPPARIRRAIVEVLGSSDREIDVDLAALGDELEFQLATNPELRARVAAVASPARARVMSKALARSGRRAAPAPAARIGSQGSSLLRRRLGETGPKRKARPTSRSKRKGRTR